MVDFYDGQMRKTPAQPIHGDAKANPATL